MNRGQLIETLMQVNGYTRSEADNALNAVIDAVTEGLATDGNVTIRNFVTFNTVTLPAREMHNPFNNEPMTVPERATVRAKASKNLAKDVRVRRLMRRRDTSQ